ncbi:MAG: DUF4199 domain-containing protein [Bacteroidales bacterium]
MEETSGKPFLRPALIYGAILGFVSIFLSVVFYFLGLTFEGWTGWVSFAVGIVVLAYCLFAYRNEYLGGYASYGRLFLMAVVTGLIASVLSTAYTYLLYAVIDPDLMEKTSIMAEERILANSRIPENMKDDVIEKMQDRMTLSRMIVSTFVGGTIIYAIFGLIVAAFAKKEETPANQAM